MDVTRRGAPLQSGVQFSAGEQAATALQETDIPLLQALPAAVLHPLRQQAVKEVAAQRRQEEAALAVAQFTRATQHPRLRLQQRPAVAPETLLAKVVGYATVADTLQRRHQPLRIPLHIAQPQCKSIAPMHAALELARMTPALQYRDLIIHLQPLPVGLRPAGHAHTEPLARDSVAVLEATEANIPRMNAGQG